MTQPPREFLVPSHPLSAEPLAYTASGIDSVVLLNGFERIDTGYGTGVAIQDLDGLHRAIGIRIAIDQATPSPQELRFLRKLMDMTQADLANLLRVDQQTVARYEKGESSMPYAAGQLAKIHLILRLLPEAAQMEVIRTLVEARESAGPASTALRDAKSNWHVNALGTAALAG